MPVWLVLQMAIEFDRNGDVEKSGQAFAAAARHTKTANTLVNLGGEKLVDTHPNVLAGFASDNGSLLPKPCFHCR